MFLVFDEVKRGIYKRTAVSQEHESDTTKKEKTERHIDGPLEIKGNEFYSPCFIFFFSDMTHHFEPPYPVAAPLPLMSCLFAIHRNWLASV